jgi:hypothetical protein
MLATGRSSFHYRCLFDAIASNWGATDCRKSTLRPQDVSGNSGVRVPLASLGAHLSVARRLEHRGDRTASLGAPECFRANTAKSRKTWTKSRLSTHAPRRAVALVAKPSLPGNAEEWQVLNVFIAVPGEEALPELQRPPDSAQAAHSPKSWLQNALSLESHLA